MTRQKSLNILWRRLITIFVILIGTAICIFYFGNEIRVLALLFIFGNLGSYLSIHKSLGDLDDDEVIELSNSWLALITPAIVGGILSIMLYILFLSGLVGGELFPTFKEDPQVRSGLDALLDQHATGMAEYAKLLFWGFLAGFNQKYAIDIISSVRHK
ncbi:hypothetical protein [Arenicella xantha]|uniref:Uncharacterized protein n=1 Tax=Arenicella xantha TaxID=644221 RepID=A0A395JVD3_9GAMM|nr:hypothetical protein [Arenicella xantha]RBP53528.1 hypothetical protein DFR28_101915 [Arenicella xantha]